MTKQKTGAYYDHHWKDFADSGFPEVKTVKVRGFFQPIIGRINKKTTILDVGCGDGVHWNYIANIEKLPLIYTGIDVSEQAIGHLNRISDNKNASFHVMDACQLDFPDNHFDIVFAYGVIGYTDDPQAALLEMCRVCKPGGSIGVFSPDIKGISKKILFILRSIAKPLGKRGKRILANLLVPFFGLAPSETQITLKNASWRQVCEVILTDIAPPKLQIISHEELAHWLEQLRLEILYDDQEVRTILWGIKS